jgi:cytochrome c-type biogenesis protein CcmF
VIPEIGQVALLLALAVAAIMGTLPIVGAARGRSAWMALARPSAQALFVLVAVAFACLVVAFVRHDFSVAYVAENSNLELPLFYRVAAVWGGHEGSLLLWLLMLAGWTLAVAQFSRSLPEPFVARVLGMLGLINIGFLLFTIATSNPFERLLPAPADGHDLNPLLQDIGMLYHPPMLYMGYVGFSVAFAFAGAALLSGQLDTAWARWTRPWTTAAWCFLTFGIMLGSAWAYYELGWGGWWFWDPVENASFLPWLVGTALIHSLAVTEKRGAFKAWTVLLALAAFALSLLGAFLVRSGVLSSVHAFATDPQRGMFLLAFMLVVVGGSLALYAWRAPTMGLGARFGTVSRETFLLGNNVLFVAAAGSVLLGTLYPLLIDALGLGKISVGPPYFEAVFAPLMALVAFLLGIGPLARWKQAEVPDLARRLRWAVPVTIGASLGAGWLAGRISPIATVGFAMTFWIMSGAIVDLWERIAPSRAVAASRLRQIRQRLALLPRAWWGMFTAHAGIAVFTFGVTMVMSYEITRDVTLAPGESVAMGTHRFTFHGVRPAEGPNYDAVQGLVTVSKGDRVVAELFPEKRIYRVRRDPMTEAGIDSGFTRDLFVSLGEPVPGANAWVLHVAVKPFIDWIWGGCVLMMLGGALAASDRRYRVKATRRSEDAAPVAPGATGSSAGAST